MSLGRYARDAREFFVVTPFAWGDVAYAEGDDFSAVAAGLDEMTRRSLWVSNLIGVGAALPKVANPSPMMEAAPTLELTPPKPRRGRG